MLYIKFKFFDITEWQSESRGEIGSNIWGGLWDTKIDANVLIAFPCCPTFIALNPHA